MSADDDEHRSRVWVLRQLRDGTDEDRSLIALMLARKVAERLHLRDVRVKKGGKAPESSLRRWSAEHGKAEGMAVLRSAVQATARFADSPTRWHAIGVELLRQYDAARRGRGRPSKHAGLLSSTGARLERLPRHSRQERLDHGYRLQAYVAGMNARRLVDARDAARHDPGAGAHWALLHKVIAGSVRAQPDVNAALRTIAELARRQELTPEALLDREASDDVVIAAAALGIDGTPAALKKRLQRSRKLRRFLLPQPT